MKLVIKIALGIILALVLLVAGCGALVAASADDVEKAVAEATADKTGTVIVNTSGNGCWSGAFGDRTVEGCGPQSVKVEDVFLVANAQKQDAGKWELRLSLVKDGKTIDRSSTTAEYGIATVTE